MAVGKTVETNKAALASDINKMAGWGLFAARPATGDVLAGSFYMSTDTNVLYQEQNGSWVAILQVEAIVAGAETYAAGYHAGNVGGLSAIDADLTPANIKKDVNIFGKVGTYEAVLAFSEYYRVQMVGFAEYTPGDGGIFLMYSQSSTAMAQQYQHSAPQWLKVQDDDAWWVAPCIGDGTNFKIVNKSVAIDILLMRAFVANMTYERYASEDLAASATYTPADSGFFVHGDNTFDIQIDVNFATAGWDQVRDAAATDAAMSWLMGNGSNLRFRNNHGSSSRRVVIMRAGY